MAGLFDPIAIGALELPNRMMRSATVEMVADRTTGAPVPAMGEMWRQLAVGGCGLIVTGHTCVEYAGRTNKRMAAIATDALIAPWREAIRPAQEAGARIMLQINHGGALVDPIDTPDAQTASGIAMREATNPRTMRQDDIERVIAAFGKAAGRAREAGFDGVQIHAAHGYLVDQFLMAGTNLRSDTWGGDEGRRSAFYRAVVGSVREQVGTDFPVWTKLGVAGSAESGYGMDEGARVAAGAAALGIDCIEISYAWGVPEDLTETKEGQYLPLAQAVRTAVGSDYPLALVSGFRTLGYMSDLLASKVVQLISLSRPLIAEPDLANKLASGVSEEALCVRCNQCRPRTEQEGVACRNQRVQAKLRGE